METKDRREKIKDLLEEKNYPIKGSDLAKIFNVSRQIIVQDIALLRAKGEEIVSTPQGYIIFNENNKSDCQKKIAVKHTKYEIEDELNTIIDFGGTVIDIVVEHPVYGELKKLLMLESRMEIKEFIEDIKKNQAEPLSALSNGVHIHTIKAKNEETLEKIEQALYKKGYLIEL